MTFGFIIIKNLIVLGKTIFCALLGKAFLVSYITWGTNYQGTPNLEPNLGFGLISWYTPTNDIKKRCVAYIFWWFFACGLKGISHKKKSLSLFVNFSLENEKKTQDKHSGRKKKHREYQLYI